MVVANFLDLAIGDLHHLGADAFNDPAGALSGSIEIRLGHRVTGVAGKAAQVATAVRHQRKCHLIVAPYRIASFEAFAFRILDTGVFVKTRHHALDVVPIECVEVTLDELLFGSHRETSSGRDLINIRHKGAQSKSKRAPGGEGTGDRSSLP